MSLVLVLVGCSGSSELEDTTGYLTRALEAEAFLEANRIETSLGSAWPRIAEDPESVELSLYSGFAGVVLFYLELYEATGDKRFLDRAKSGGNEILNRFKSEEWDPWLYSGMAGLAFILEEIGEATGDGRFTSAAYDAVERLKWFKSDVGAGVGWVRPIPFADSFELEGETEVWDVAGGSAGVGLALLEATATDLHESAMEMARGIGDRLVEVAREEETGLSWAMMETDPGWTAPNFSHGTSGIAYYLARLHEETGEQAYLDAAVGGARYLQSIADVSDDGTSHLIYHHEGDGEDLYYLSWCHGPVGTTRLFHVLGRITSDDTWNDWVISGGEGILSTGAPEERSPGYWNNVSQCCGDAGVGEFALDLYDVTGDDKWLDLARRVGDEIAAKSQPGLGGGICWLQAEHRVRPEFLEAQTGYMQGAAGVGSFFLRLHTTIEGEPVDIKLPDSPFGSP